MKLGQKHAKVTKQDIAFLKLDFEKAYDRVDHGFLWATLMEMNVDPRVLTLIKGLIMNAHSKVHINGLFIKPFLLQRGGR